MLTIPIYLVKIDYITIPVKQFHPLAAESLYARLFR